jgi:hypothetical protein
MNLALLLCQMAKAGYHVTLAFRDDAYYTITTRVDGLDYKRTNIPRSEVTLALHEGRLEDFLAERIRKNAGFIPPS